MSVPNATKRRLLLELEPPALPSVGRLREIATETRLTLECAANFFAQRWLPFVASTSQRLELYRAPRGGDALFVLPRAVERIFGKKSSDTERKIGLKRRECGFLEETEEKRGALELTDEGRGVGKTPGERKRATWAKGAVERCKSAIVEWYERFSTAGFRVKIRPGSGGGLDDNGVSLGTAETEIPPMWEYVAEQLDGQMNVQQVYSKFKKIPFAEKMVFKKFWFFKVVFRKNTSKFIKNSLK